MEDFPVLLLFFIIYLIAGSSRKKNKKAPRSSPMRTRARGEQRDARALERDRQTKDGFLDAFDGACSSGENAACAQQPIHLHAASQEQLRSAAEGEDPCHAGGMEHVSQVEQEAAEQEDAQQKLCREVLRGVIMGEILTRPCDRMAMRRSDHRNHGY